MTKAKFSPNKQHGRPFRKPVIDARNKIIQKHRSKIHDAREKLAQITKQNGDVRQKLLRKGIENRKFITKQPLYNAPLARPKPLKRPYNPAPAYIEHDVRMDTTEYLPALRRTVKNDVPYVSRMPSLPTYKHIEDPRAPIMDSSWSASVGADPFDCYEVPQARPFDVSEPRNLNRHLTIQMRPHSEQKPMHSIPSDSLYAYGESSRGQRTVTNYDRYRDGNGHLSYEMRSRLHQSPDRSQSMGIFSNPYASRTEETRPKTGFRIVVSNLHSSVTQNDVKVSNYTQTQQSAICAPNHKYFYNYKIFRSCLKTLANYWRRV